MSFMDQNISEYTFVTGVQTLFFVLDFWIVVCQNLSITRFFFRRFFSKTFVKECDLSKNIWLQNYKRIWITNDLKK